MYKPPPPPPHLKRREVVYWNRCVRVFVCSCVRVLSGLYLLKHLTFYNQTLYGGASSWTGVSCKKNSVLTSRSRSSEGFLLSEHDCFNCIFWTADPSATKHSLMIISWDVLWKDQIAVFKVKVTPKVQIFYKYLDDTFCTTEPFVTKLCIVMDYCRLQCYVKRLVC